MASSGKKKTTMAKLQREGRMREKRQDKLARKVQRRQNAAMGITTYADSDVDEFGEPIAHSDEEVGSDAESADAETADAEPAETAEPARSERSGR
jgi:hypothetical protein